jgi:hypothetical protein
MAVALLYRGDATPHDRNQAVSLVKAKASFNLVEWCSLDLVLTKTSPTVNCQFPYSFHIYSSSI